MASVSQNYCRAHTNDCSIWNPVCSALPEILTSLCIDCATQKLQKCWSSIIKLTIMSVSQLNDCSAVGEESWSIEEALFLHMQATSSLLLCKD